MCKHELDQGICDINSHEKTYLKEENKLLKQMLADKNIIINDKEQLIQLSYEKIGHLETQIKIIGNKISADKHTKQDDHIITVKQVASEIMKIQTENQASEIINLVNDDYPTGKPMLTSKMEQNEASRNGFTLVKKHRKAKTHKIGSGEEAQNFQEMRSQKKRSGY
ncbi:hypothetical protein NQ317_013963 [Molorchus minor]|uniref:Uncharacterized protein n=1 Tax=Molorchus minor TaxID=1323400 RepID=A0ABQ9J181_9CUCU|nr:hypothetical protein NQ317_013963 [Molorchus minor]